MNTTILRGLNSIAKAWPYHVGNRPAQRSTIRADLKTIREALDYPHGHMVLGNENVLYGLNWNLSGFGLTGARTYILAGIPTLVLWTADRKALIEQVVRGPMVSPDGSITGTTALDDLRGLPRAFHYVPLAEIMRDRFAIGATLFNWNPDCGCRVRTGLHPWTATGPASAPLDLDRLDLDR